VAFAFLSAGTMAGIGASGRPLGSAFGVVHALLAGTVFPWRNGSRAGRKVPACAV
jgi:hypothetical protein